MILVDTSIWIDHFRTGDQDLADLLDERAVLAHAFVIGELALGQLAERRMVLEFLQDIPLAITASENEVLYFIEKHRLAGHGIGYVDAHILASAQLTAGTRLWTRDKRLSAVAEQMGLSMETTAPLH